MKEGYLLNLKLYFVSGSRKWECMEYRCKSKINSLKYPLNKDQVLAGKFWTYILIGTSNV